MSISALFIITKTKGETYQRQLAQHPMVKRLLGVQQPNGRLNTHTFAFVPTKNDIKMTVKQIEK